MQRYVHDQPLAHILTKHRVGYAISRRDWRAEPERVCNAPYINPLGVGTTASGQHKSGIFGGCSETVPKESCHPVDRLTQRLCQHSNRFGILPGHILRRLGLVILKPWKRGSPPSKFSHSLPPLELRLWGQYYSTSWSLILQAVATMMMLKETYILAAVDGQDGDISSGRSSSSAEPAVFFFVIYGLVHEALSASSTESLNLPSGHSTTLAALQALQYLVRPEYAGKAILEPTIFDEFMSVSYRMAMTEPASVQIPLIDTLVSLSISHNLAFGDA